MNNAYKKKLLTYTKMEHNETNLLGLSVLTLSRQETDQAYQLPRLHGILKCKISNCLMKANKCYSS